MPAWTNLFGFTGPSGNGGHFDIEAVGTSGGATYGYYGLHNYGWQQNILPIDLEWHHLSATYDGTTASWSGDGILVTIPEALGVQQAQRLVGEFAQYGLCIRHLIVNNVIEQPDSDFLRRRQAMQRPYIGLLEAEYGSTMTLTRLPLFADEIKGVDRLRRMEEMLFAPERA